jgi:ABC-2 type transport system ATP-binding protein
MAEAAVVETGLPDAMASGNVGPSPLMAGISRPAVVRVTGFRKQYGRTVAADGVDLTVAPGEIYGLIGPDGAGKSSLMKAIAGVQTYDAGQVEVFGIPLASEEAAEAIKGRIGFMPQGLGLNLYPELSIEENIDFFARLRMVPEAELARRKRRLLRMTRLEPFRDRPMKNLSGGMKQKLGLVCTLIHEPELVILDEPTTGVDPVSRRDFWAILAQLLRERGMAAVVSTAYLDEASRFHHLSLLYDGRVLAEGEPDAIQTLVPGSLVSLRAESPMEALTRLKAHFSQVEALGPWIKTFVDGA